MNENMIPGERLYPCPSCAEPTIVRDRVYTTDGYPYVHECPSAPRKVPNEGDFCPACHALTWAGLCEACQKRPVRDVVHDLAQEHSAPPSGPRKRGMGRAW